MVKTSSTNQFHKSPPQGLGLGNTDKKLRTENQFHKTSQVVLTEFRGKSMSLSMVRKVTWLILFSVCFFGLSSCNKEHDGQLFIVTEGSENVMLGGVVVAFYSESELYEQLQLFAKEGLGESQEIFDTVIEDTLSIQKNEGALGIESGHGDPAYVWERIVLSKVTNYLIDTAENKVNTDASGKFSISAGSDLYLVARGERMIGDSKEYYRWIYKCDSDSTSHILSNQEQTDNEDIKSLLVAAGVEDILNEVPEY